MVEQLNRLLTCLAKGAPPAVAYSGGVDSTLVLAAAVQARHGDCLGLLARTPTLAKSEEEAALALARQLHLPVLPIEVDTLQSERVAHNCRDRCYHCKRLMGSALFSAAQAHGFTRLLDGSHQDDKEEYRPGARAFAELGVESPLVELAINKTGVRSISEILGLANAQKPAAPCLLTRFPYDLPFALTPKDLSREAAGEEVLRPYCKQGYRLRQNGRGASWIAVSASDFPAIAEHRGKLLASLLELGFSDVKLDLLPLRSGEFDQEDNHENSVF